MSEFRWEQIKFGDRVYPQSGEHSVFIQDVNSGENAILTNEVYEVVKQICDNKWNISDVTENCETEDDKEYILRVLNKLADKRIIRDINDYSEYADMDIVIDWDVTNRCNLLCRHCCQNAGNEYIDISKEDCFQIVDKLIGLKPVSINISGGEPLMRKDFEDIVTRLRLGYSGKLSLMTNATLVDKNKAEFISRNFNSVSVSLDGYDEETCAIIRGKGVFARSVEGINQLKRGGVEKISASMVVTKVTADHKEEFKTFCDRIGVEPYFRRLDLIGRAKEELTDFIVDEEEMIYSEAQYDEKGTLTKEARPIRAFSCRAAFGQFQIDYKGNIYPCQALMDEPLKLGNVLEIVDLNDYLRKRLFTQRDEYKTLERYFPYNFEPCGECGKALLCWHCIEPLFRNGCRRSNCEKCREVFENYL